jgi:hypothetical protein
MKTKRSSNVAALVVRKVQRSDLDAVVALQSLSSSASHLPTRYLMQALSAHKNCFYGAFVGQELEGYCLGSRSLGENAVWIESLHISISSDVSEVSKALLSAVATAAYNYGCISIHIHEENVESRLRTAILALGYQRTPDKAVGGNTLVREMNERIRTVAGGYGFHGQI